MVSSLETLFPPLFILAQLELGSVTLFCKSSFEDIELQLPFWSQSPPLNTEVGGGRRYLVVQYPILNQFLWSFKNYGVVLVSPILSFTISPDHAWTENVKV